MINDQIPITIHNILIPHIFSLLTFHFSPLTFLPFIIFAALAPIKNTKAKSGAQPSLNLACALTLFSLTCCWFYGLPALAAGFFGLRNIIRLKKAKKPSKKSTVFKLKWGLIIGWSGLIFSGIFTVYYIIALITGSFIRL